MPTVFRRSATTTNPANPGTPGTAVAVARRGVPVPAAAAGPATHAGGEPGFTELQPGTPYEPPGRQEPYQREMTRQPNAQAGAALYGMFQQAPSFKEALDAILLASGPESFEVLEVNESEQRREAMTALNRSYPGVLPPFWARGHNVDPQGYRKRAWIVWEGPFMYGFIALFQTGNGFSHGASHGVKEWWFQATDPRTETPMSLAHYLHTLRMSF